MTTKSPTTALYSNSKPQPSPRTTCLCSPTNHPGSFRCSRHRNLHKFSDRKIIASPAGSWELAKVAKSNSVMKAFLKLIIKPSTRDLQRRRNFQQKPSRFCMLNGSGNRLAEVY